MKPICQHCGVRGWPEFLTCCFNCSEAYVHCYCFEDASMIFEQDVEWTCPDCYPKPAKLLPSRRSKRITSEHAKKCKRRLMLLKSIRYKMRLTGRKSMIDVLTQKKSQKCDMNPLSKGVEVPSTVDSGNHNVLDDGCSAKKSQEYDRNSLSDGVEMPSAVDSETHNVLDDGFSANMEMRDPPSLSTDHEDRGSTPEQETTSVLVDGHVSRVVSIAKESSSVMLNNNCYEPAMPVDPPIWRGCFCIHNKGFQIVDGVAAHLSHNACKRVHEEACLLPVNIYFDILSKFEVWPKSFQQEKPTDDHIALFFFPETESGEEIFKSLLVKMRQHNLALRRVVENAELLVFTSLELPVDYRRFKGNYFLWGIFKGK